MAEEIRSQASGVAAAVPGGGAAAVQGVVGQQCQLGRARAGVMLHLPAEGEPAVVAQWPAEAARGGAASERPTAGGPAAGAAPAKMPGWLGLVANRLVGLDPLGPAAIVPLGDDRPRLYGQGPGPSVVMMVVRSGGDGARRVEAFLVEPDDERDLEHRAELLRLSVLLLRVQSAEASAARESARAQRLAGVIEAQDALGGSDRFRGAAMALCNEVCSRLGAERVSLGFVAGRGVKLSAMSQTEHVNRRMKLVGDIEAAMEECTDQDIEVLHPSSPAMPFVSRSAAALSKRHGPAAVVTLPLRDGSGEPAGALTVERDPARPVQPEELTTLRLVCNLLTPRLLELRDHDRWVGARLASGVRRQAARALGPEHTWAKLGAVALIAVLCFLTFARGTDWVEASFVIEPIVQRSVPAPWDGYLTEVGVEPGDVVTAGVTVLGRLETTELRLELAELRAQQASALKEADIARRDDEQAERQVALARADQAAARIELLEHRLSQAALVSPVSGVVTRGDLKKELGRPVEKGQVLFEVAPLDSLRAVLMVPEGRVFDVAAGQRGELATASHPGDKLPFVVEHVHPVAEVVDQRNVFRVRARLAGEAAGQWLRPGVEGVAKADAGRARYAWLWTRDAVNWVRMKLWL